MPLSFKERQYVRRLSPRDLYDHIRIVDDDAHPTRYVDLVGSADLQHGNDRTHHSQDQTEERLTRGALAPLFKGEKHGTASTV